MEILPGRHVFVHLSDSSNELRLGAHSRRIPRFSIAQHNNLQVTLRNWIHWTPIVSLKTSLRKRTKIHVTYYKTVVARKHLINRTCFDWCLRRKVNYYLYIVNICE